MRVPTSRSGANVNQVENTIKYLFKHLLIPLPSPEIHGSVRSGESARSRRLPASERLQIHGIPVRRGRRVLRQGRVSEWRRVPGQAGSGGVRQDQTGSDGVKVSGQTAIRPSDVIDSLPLSLLSSRLVLFSPCRLTPCVSPTGLSCRPRLPWRLTVCAVLRGCSRRVSLTAWVRWCTETAR